jgi:hypothetical protein
MPVNTPFLSDVYEFELLGIRLMHKLKSWTDKIEFRNAVHEFLKRDGASIERGGRKPAKFRFSIFLLGPNWRIEYGNLLAKAQDNNKTECVHPLLGPLQVAIDDIELQSTPGTGRDLAEITISVTEDRVDLALAREEEPRPLELSARAQLNASQAQSIVESAYPYAVGEVRRYVAAVTAYSLLAEQSLADPIAALSLETQLAQVAATSDACIQSLLSDALTGYQCDAFDAVDQITQGYASLVELQFALQKEGRFPEIIDLTVSQPLIQWCAQRYGGANALRQAELIERMNKLPDVTWVPQGTRLLVPPVLVPR